MPDIDFDVNENGNIIHVSYNEDMTCEEFMYDFTKKHTNYASTDPNIYTFKIGTRILNSPTVKGIKIKELIKANQFVKFVRKKNMSYSQI
jgi:hypothetical protein